MVDPSKHLIAASPKYISEDNFPGKCVQLRSVFFGAGPCGVETMEQQELRVEWVWPCE